MTKKEQVNYVDSQTPEERARQRILQASAVTTTSEDSPSPKAEGKVGLYEQVNVGESYDCGASDCKKSHIKASPSPESWEIGFEKFNKQWEKEGYLSMEELKSFIKETISSEKAKAKEQWKKEALAELPDKLQGLDYAQGYNAALEQAKELIENS